MPRDGLRGIAGGFRLQAVGGGAADEKARLTQLDQTGFVEIVVWHSLRTNDGLGGAAAAEEPPGASRSGSLYAGF